MSIPRIFNGEITMAGRACGRLLLVMVAVMGPTGGEPLQAQGRRLPSEVLHDIALGRLRGAGRTPADIEAALGPLLAAVQTTGLSAEEEVALALGYFLTFDGPSARPLFEKHMNRPDIFGRVSWQSLQQMSFFGARDYALVERRTAEFRQRYPAVAEDLEYTFNMVGNLARHFLSRGDTARAVRLILDDVRSLPPDLPLRSFELLGIHFAAFRATGQAQVAIDLLKRHREGLRAAADSDPSSGRGPASAGEGLRFAHRAGVFHLKPFMDLLFPDDTGWTPEGTVTFRRGQALGRLDRWIAAAERGEPIPLP